MLACPALQTSSIISARWMVSKIVAPKSRRLRMRRALMPFFGGRFFGSNGGRCRRSDGRHSSGIAGAAAERKQRQYQPDRERENRRLAAHYHCPHYRFHDARPLSVFNRECGQIHAHRPTRLKFLPSHYAVETGLPGWRGRTRTAKSLRELCDWNLVTTQLELGPIWVRRPCACELRRLEMQLGSLEVHRHGNSADATRPRACCRG
jgi:hypothetical protein